MHEWMLAKSRDTRCYRCRQRGLRLIYLGRRLHCGDRGRNAELILQRREMKRDLDLVRVLVRRQRRPYTRLPYLAVAAVHRWNLVPPRQEIEAGRELFEVRG